MYQNGGKYTKLPKNRPNVHKLYQMAVKQTKCPLSIPNGCKIDQMSIKYSNIFQCKTLQSLPEFGFLV
jgi:hypothetical protein